MKKVFIIILIIIINVCALYFFKKAPETEEVASIQNPNTTWKVTQYGSNTGGQLMCYTVEGNKSGLIIVDGGYENDEAQLKILEDIIKKHGNYVDAWILTHFDTDHAGAYMAIRNRYKELKVGKLYVQDTPDLETCKSKAKWYTGWDLYDKYLKLNIPEKTFAHTGDESEIIGLKFKVLSSYEKWIGEKCSNLLNNGSIVFKLSGKSESMLFCADVQDTLIGDRMLKNYYSYLPSTYLQVPHHGNNSLSKKFYQRVHPKVAFFPAPTSIINNVNHISWFTEDKMKEIFTEMKCTMYNFSNSPASVIIH